MNTHLSKILEKKEEEIATLYRERGLGGFSYDSYEPRFIQALSRPGLQLIAEVKKASPSKGIIRDIFEPLSLAQSFAQQGASALSVLTEIHYFLGSPDYIPMIRAQVDLPILRKDFILDPIQLYEAKSLGADAILLIKAILSQSQSQELLEVAKELHLDVLMEIHNQEELEAVMQLKGGFAIGINNRNLKTFEVDLNTALQLGQQIRAHAPAHTVMVAESGYTTLSELDVLRKYSFNAVLIGEGLARFSSIFKGFL